MATCLVVRPVNAVCNSVSSLGFALYWWLVRDMPISLHAFRVLSCSSVTKKSTASRFSWGVTTFFQSGFSWPDSLSSSLQTFSLTPHSLSPTPVAVTHQWLPYLRIWLSVNFLRMIIKFKVNNLIHVNSKLIGRTLGELTIALNMVQSYHRWTEAWKKLFEWWCGIFFQKKNPGVMAPGFFLKVMIVISVIEIWRQSSSSGTTCCSVATSEYNGIATLSGRVKTI